MTPKLITTLQDYSLPLFRADLFAGITVAMVAMPLSLAIAIASGAGPETGLVTAIVAGFLISALGGSRVQIGGPTGAFIVVVAGVISEYGLSGLATASFMAGIILVAAGLLRAGKLIRFVPEPVINGFTIGIAIIIALSQLRDVLGVTAPMPAEALEKIAALWHARGEIALWPCIIGVATIALISLFRRLAPSLPGLIVAVALTSGAVALFGLPVETLGDRFGELPRGLPMPALPDLSPARLRELLPSAFVIAFLAGVESLLSAMVSDRMTGFRHRSGAELMAQGWANIASPLFGGLPATGAIARTATNIRAGGRTPVSGIVHALTIFLAMLIAAPLASALAMPALAGLLLLTAWNMSEPQHWKSNFLGGRRSDRVLLVMTLLLTVFADLTIAIGVGVTAGLALRLQRREVPPADWTPPDR